MLLLLRVLLLGLPPSTVHPPPSPALPPARALDSQVILVGDSGVGKSQILNRFARGTFAADSKSTIGAGRRRGGAHKCRHTRGDADSSSDRGGSRAGVEFASKAMRVGGGELVKMQIWDTAGQERYRAITSGEARGGGGVCVWREGVWVVGWGGGERRGAGRADDALPRRPAAYYRGAVGAIIVYDLTSLPSFQHVGKWVEELRDHASSDCILMLLGNKSDLQAQRAVSAAEGGALAQAEGGFFLEASAKEGTNVADAFERMGHEVCAGVGGRAGWGATHAPGGATAAVALGRRGRTRGTHQRVTSLPPRTQIHVLMRRTRWTPSGGAEAPRPLPAGVTIAVAQPPPPAPRRGGCGCM